MEGLEELVVSNDQASQMVMIKGKRTKRQRPLSPNGVVVAAAAVTSSSSSACGGDQEFNFYGNNNSFSSPTTSSGDMIYESTEEEEDMANCLILLAQGDHVANNDPKQIIEERSNGRRSLINEFDQNSSIGKAGFYVYECKTCSRTFSSFQALGGHRASHKKPKAMTSPDEKCLKNSKSSAPIHGIKASLFQELEDQTKQFIKSTAIPIQIGAKSKIHECSICGSEFTSGQALGGHMRRHRAAAANNSTSNTSNVNGASIKLQSNVFSLDLNLPAPEDHDLHHQHSKFQFVPTQQTSLVFNAPALVDCHY